MNFVYSPDSDCSQRNYMVNMDQIAPASVQILWGGVKISTQS